MQLVLSKSPCYIDKIAPRKIFCGKSYRFRRLPYWNRIPQHPNEKGAVNRQPGLRAEDSENWSPPKMTKTNAKKNNFEIFSVFLSILSKTNAFIESTVLKLYRFFKQSAFLYRISKFLKFFKILHFFSCILNKSASIFRNQIYVFVMFQIVPSN